ncbi:CAP domain-containing protein [Nocardioides sp.]|uniref:CAP domain-containing protein n=1 Tax=Nocardioides sp. TaxID=35761 RepID=UPI002CF19D28|nr:CAP domain-containing protein [Nocardioides sp.]HXH80788.1 CAP domain-containing protein [Nocardioides sp.]
MSAHHTRTWAAVGVGALLTTLLTLPAAATPSVPGERHGEVADARCTSGTKSVDLRRSRVRVSRTSLSTVRVRPAAGGGFVADASVGVKGTAWATVRVKADACPIGRPGPEAVTRTAGWTGTRIGRVARVRHPQRVAARKNAITQATHRGRDRIRGEAVRRATATAARDAMEKSRGLGVPSPGPRPPTTEELQAFAVNVRAAIVTYTNIERARASVAPLTTMQPVTTGAQDRAQSMTSREVLEPASATEVRNNPGVEQCTEQRVVSELIYGFTLVDGFSDEVADEQARLSVASWVSSPQPHQVMVDAAYSRTGVGVGLARSDLPGIWRVGVVQRLWGGDCPQHAG